MGTPGDQTKLGKVVRSDPSQLDPEQGDQPTTKPSQQIPETPAPLPSTSTADMGVYRGTYTRLPHFESFTAIGANPSLSQATEKIDQLPATAASLGQATIEDYFVQSKYYPSLAESIQGIYVPEKQAKTFPNPDEPGPSGLQTPRSKTTAVLPKVKKSRKSQQTPKKPFECAVCQKIFPNAARLSRHQSVHGGQSPYKCEHCKKSFTSRFKLVRHALIHSDRKPFSCQVCERTFHRKDHLKNHIKVHSPSKKIYVCERPDCKKEYTSLMSYRKHLALHAAQEGSLECQICFSTFETKDEILYHLKIHAGSRTVKNPNEKKFTCEHCGRKFFTKKDVRRHLVVHTGMRDFLCQFCPQRFGRKDHLVRHIKKSHGRNLPAETDAENVTVKTEAAETHTKPETVLVKSEGDSSEPFAPLGFNIETFGETSLIFGQEFDQLNPETLQYLPSTSAETSEALAASFLDVPAESGSHSDITPQLLDESVLIQDPEFMRLLQQSEDKNLPLPGFSQTFQSPPPPP